MVYDQPKIARGANIIFISSVVALNTENIIKLVVVPFYRYFTVILPLFVDFWQSIVKS